MKKYIVVGNVVLRKSDGEFGAYVVQNKLTLKLREFFGKDVKFDVGNCFIYFIWNSDLASHTAYDKAEMKNVWKEFGNDWEELLGVIEEGKL